MCTSIRVNAADKSVVVARTMEFPSLMGATFSVIPRGVAMHSYAADGSHGVEWESRFGAIGIDAFPQVDETGPYLWTDGLNEKGLWVGLLYHPGFCELPSPDGTPNDRLIALVHLAAYLLTTCGSVAEARDAVNSLVVWGWKPAVVPFQIEGHFAVQDASGAMVLEWSAGELKVFDNPIGVLTNAPNFDWHLTNLGNYASLRAEAATGLEVRGVKVAPLGIGSGMIGLPGDPTPPNRFVRAVALSTAATPPADAAGAENTALHIINNFDLPHGYARTATQPPTDDITFWTCIANLAEPSYSVRMAVDHTFRTVRLSDLDLDEGVIQTFPLPGPDSFPVLKLA